MKKLLIVVAILAVFIFVIGSKNKESIVEQTVPIHQRGYDLGLSYVPAYRPFDSNQAYEKIKEVAEVALIVRKWTELTDPNLNLENEVRVAREKGLKIFLYFEILDGERKNFEVPSGVNGDFNNPSFQKAYLDVITRLAREHRPDYFIINVEANLQEANDKQGYEAFKTFYPKAYQEVKKASPLTDVAVSLNLTDFNGKDGLDEADKETFRKHANDFEQYADILAVSVYPFWYLHPSKIPDSFLTELSLYSARPLFIVETSWVSHSFTIPFGPIPFTFKSDPQTQAAYVAKLASAAKHMQEQGKTIVGINFISLIDIPKETCDVLKAQAPLFEWFCYLGLLEPSGEEKPAFGKMREWKNMR